MKTLRETQKDDDPAQVAFDAEESRGGRDAAFDRDSQPRFQRIDDLGLHPHLCPSAGRDRLSSLNERLSGAGLKRGGI